MKRHLPGRIELTVFVGMAVVAGLLVTASEQRDAMLFFVTMPVFLVSAFLGFRRKLALQTADVSSPGSVATRE